MKKIIISFVLLCLPSFLVYAQSPVADNFDDGLGSQWEFANLGTGPTKGEAPTEGMAEAVDGMLNITNNGWDQWEDDDGMGFLYQEVSGDFDVAVHVVSFDPDVNNVWEKSGIAFRQSLEADAKYVSSMLSRGNGLRAQFRFEQGDNTNRAVVSDAVEGWWVRLQRVGDIFAIMTAESMDGPWIEATEPADRALPDSTLVVEDPAFLGIAYTPHNTDAEGELNGTGVFDDFVIMQSTSNATNWECYD